MGIADYVIWKEEANNTKHDVALSLCKLHSDFCIDILSSDSRYYGTSLFLMLLRLRCHTVLCLHTVVNCELELERCIVGSSCLSATESVRANAGLYRIRDVLFFYLSEEHNSAFRN
jgi:hypothetical protein